MLYNISDNPDYCHTLEYKIENTPFMSQFHFGYARYRYMLIIAICDMMHHVSDNPEKRISVKFKNRNQWTIEPGSSWNTEELNKLFPLLHCYLDKITHTCDYQTDNEDDEEWGIHFINNYEWHIWDTRTSHACALNIQTKEDREQLEVVRMLIGFYLSKQQKNQ